MASKIPERVRLAVELLAVEPDDRVLELGCGSGVAAGLVCDRLRSGTLLAIDRSKTQIERAARRNQDHLVSGRLALQAVDLASVDVGEARFDKAFAINVNLFWLGPATRELERLRQALAPEGRLFLFYELPRSRIEETARRAAAVLASERFAEPGLIASTGSVIGVVSRPAARK